MGTANLHLDMCTDGQAMEVNRLRPMQIVAVLVVLLFIVSVLLFAGCGKKQPAENSDQSSPAEGSIEKGLKAPGEARGAAQKANKQIESQQESADDLEGGNR